MAAELAAHRTALVSLFKTARAHFADAHRAVDAFGALCAECDDTVCASALNVAQRAALCANTDTALGCLDAFPRIRERLLAKQLDQLGLLLGALKSRTYGVELQVMICVANFLGDDARELVSSIPHAHTTHIFAATR